MKTRIPSLVPRGVAGAAAAVLALGVVGWPVLAVVERSAKQQLGSELQTILEADIAALRLWLDGHEAAGRLWAIDPDVRSVVVDLVASRHTADRAELLGCEHQGQLRELLGPVVETYGYQGAGIVSASGRVLADLYDEPVGERASPEFLDLLDRAVAGQVAISKPYPSTVPLRDPGDAPPRIGRPTMVLGAPVFDETGRTTAMLGFRMSPSELSRILAIARSGETGETYAFDRHGRMLSRSRFPAELAAAGLLAPGAGGDSTLQIEIRDPGRPLAELPEPLANPSGLPLTAMAVKATTGDDGVALEPYRNYRGVEVVGAWRWLDELDLGVTTEVEASEAFAPLRILREAFGGLLALLGISLVAVIAATLRARQLAKAVEEIRTLGPYQLVRKLGEGGMGEVHLARHALLQRPTAIKLLHPANCGPSHLERFEREVRLTSRLTHPNTIAVYDYGRTPDGIFYYAMEYVRGFALPSLIDLAGPLPESRVIHILTQVCGSLEEAHGLGLIHRDIKPANVMLCERGGRVDVVKLLDFGLVREYRRERPAPAGGSNEVAAGTPAYMAPEAFDAPDQTGPASDLYSVGALAYYLLTGHPPFEARNVFQLFELHRTEHAAPPSLRLGRSLRPDLEGLVLACLAKDPAARPATAAALAQDLEQCVEAGVWTQARARTWWADHGAVLDPRDLPDAEREQESDGDATVRLHRRSGKRRRE